MLEHRSCTHAWRRCSCTLLNVRLPFQEILLSSPKSPYAVIDVWPCIATSTDLCCTERAAAHAHCLIWHVNMKVNAKHRAKATCCSAARFALFVALCAAVPAYASVVEIIAGAMPIASTASCAHDSWRSPHTHHHANNRCVRTQIPLYSFWTARRRQST